MLWMLAVAWVGRVERFVAKTLEGSVVTLIAVSDDPGRRAWAADGSAASTFKGARAKSSDLAFLVQIDVKGNASAPTAYLYRPPGYTTTPLDYPTSTTPLGTNRWRLVRYEHKSFSQSTTFLTLNVADGAWRSARRTKVHNGVPETRSRFIQNAEVIPDKRVDSKGRPLVGFPVFLPPDFRRGDVRLLGFDRLGKEIPPAGEVSFGMVSYQFFSRPIDEIVELELQSRRFSTVQFTNIRTHPNDR